MLQILYVHGFEGSGNGSSAKLIKAKLQQIPGLEFNLIAPQFKNDTSAFNQNVEKIKSLVQSKDIDIIIASSFGAVEVLWAKLWGRTNSREIILVNPALQPYTELKELGIPGEAPLRAKPTEYLFYVERQIKDLVSLYKNAWYIISANDSVIGKGRTAQHINMLNARSNRKPIILNSSDHKITAKSAQIIADIIRKQFYSKLHESVVPEYHVELDDSDIRQLYESTIYCFSKSEKEKYIDKLIPIIEKSYSNIGGFAGNIREELLDRIVFFRVETDKQNEPVVIQAYKGSKNFRKAFLFGADPGNEQKSKLVNKVFSDNLRNIKKYGYYVEVSGAPEHIFIDKFGYPVVPNEQVKKYFELLKPNMEVILHPDGKHYTRIIGGKKYTKIMVGIDPYLFLKSKKIKTY